MSPARRSLLAPLALILGFAAGRTDALARDTVKSWEVGGYTLIGRYAGGTGLDNGFGFGVRGGYHLKEIHELEGSLDRSSSDDQNLPGVSDDITKFNIDYVRIFLLKGHEKMTPFATFGVGVIKVDNGMESDSSTAYRTGGGFKYYFKPRVAFRFDVKLYRWHGDGNTVPQDPFFSMDATFGVAFLVGGAK